MSYRDTLTILDLDHEVYAHHKWRPTVEERLFDLLAVLRPGWPRARRVSFAYGYRENCASAVHKVKIAAWARVAEAAACGRSLPRELRQRLEPIMAMIVPQKTDRKRSFNNQ